MPDQSRANVTRLEADCPEGGGGRDDPFAGIHRDADDGYVVWQCGHRHYRRKYALNCAEAALTVPDLTEGVDDE